MQDTELTTSPARHRIQAAGVILLACICGWFMMELEILGVRALIPHFGSAVYVVTGSVIGVFLLSLSIGYMLGGWLSGKLNSLVTLGFIMVLTGLCFCIIPFVGDPVCNRIFDMEFDVKWGSLLASLALFGIPTILLGMVSPTVMHWLTRRAGDSGFYAGLVMATSTLSSFAGCVVTAFYLVLYSLRITLCVSGIILSVLGGLLLLAMALAGNKNQSLVKKETGNA